ncbi:MAG: nitroreductase family protein [Methanomassiliicoccales archaeon]|nr:MAG: nitroreductase family protein [Methanomassiliicoccales archaeon]
MDVLFSRRSIRRYKDRPVGDDDIHYILRAAMSAPSAGNERPWHFITIKERASLDKIMSFQPYSQMLKEAPMAILVCGDEKLEKYKGFWPQDCSAAMENMLLAACSRGLGAVWLGIYPVEDRIRPMREHMGLPEHVVPFALMALGHPNEEKPTNNRYDPSRVHSERWRGSS